MTPDIQTFLGPFIGIPLLVIGAFAFAFIAFLGGKHRLIRPVIVLGYTFVLSLSTLLFGIEWLLLVVGTLLSGGFFIGITMLRGWYRNSKLNNQLVIPEYKLTTDLKFYEVGALIDGQVSNRDLAAHFIYRRIHHETPMDDVESKLQQIFELSGGFNTVFESLAKTTKVVRNTKFSKSVSVTYVDYSGQAANIIYHELIKDGYYLFNPQTAWVWFYISSFFLFFGGLFLGMMLQQFTIISFIAYAIGIVLYQASGFTHYFAENISKSVPVINNIRGHKMFLNTAERFRITKDEALFKELVPYFVAYNIREDLAKEGIKKFDLVSETISHSFTD